MDGAFVVSVTRFKRDYQREPNEALLLGWLEKGYKLRMSNPHEGAAQPRLISPPSIFRPVLP
tara:strand:- start:3000 stop:3185 length:186 start_codon:yes stop_codon:yes gene_type:complete